MSFDSHISRELTAEIFGIIRSRRRDAEERAELRRKALCDAYPEFNAIDCELHETGSAIYSILSSGNNIQERMEKLSERNLQLQHRRRCFLEKEGLPDDYLYPEYTCFDCSDTGYILGEYCDCVKELYKKLSAKKLNASSPLKLSTFHSFDLSLISDIGNARRHMKGVFTYLKDYAENFTDKSSSLFFYGATGLGKTHLSLAIANEVTNSGKNVIYGSAPSLFQQIADERFDRVDSVGTENNLIHCDLLILDDLGAEMISQLSQSILYNIINSRLLYSRPTIISSNIDINELDEYYHERIVSRIAFSFETVPFLGHDIRQVKKSIGK